MSAVIILGTGLAGYTLAREFRKLNQTTELKLITTDDGSNYSKPMLSTGFTKGKSADDLAMQSAEYMAETLNAQILTHCKVNAIDSDAHTIELDSGETLEYSKLVLSLGAEPIRIPVEGNGSDKVFSVNDLSDYRIFRESLPEKGRVVILGAGLIGCEFANDLRNGGHSVSVVALCEQLMPGLIPEAAAQAVQSSLVDEGVEFYLGQSIQSMTQEQDELTVKLSSGETLKADLVLSAIGLKPRTALAAQAGLAVNKGIQVNPLLETSHQDIYALGDCAEVSGLNLQYVMPLMACARVLAKNLSGSPTAVKYGPMPVTVKTPACPLVTAPPATSAQGTWQVELDGPNVRALFTDGKDLHGFALTGSMTSDKVQLTRRLPSLL
ncbi:NAD(P)/FAD-dependent oxidoreductase [Endozoicomonas arenosclerae]|uniref:NAD(P)/FAD-dependent oxidoreductase n=1 Tax=Endozoicomonas arenosclerae TaxID=1633495 RepID=UPI000785B4B3|nr:FAD-dependent oxidoreductase [Endozoicomonas arenosclerae]